MTIKIKKDVLLAPYTTFKIGGETKFFGIVKNIEDLKQGVSFASQNSLPLFILGGGSNLLISDNGFNGLVLKIEINFLDIRCLGNDEVEVVAGAGMILDDLIHKMTKKNLWGMENLSWIPGTVGASAVQNCGAFGTEAEDVISWVEIFDIETGKTKKLLNKECQFEYRSSIFKTKSNWIITRVAYKLKEKDEKMTSADARKAIIETRKKASPWLEGLGSAGCFFKNPIITKKEFEKLKEKFPKVPNFEEGENIKIPIAWFIDKFGWKGFWKGEVGVYDKHALMLVNKGKGTCEEIQNLAQKIKDDVFKKTGLKLEEEVVFV